MTPLLLRKSVPSGTERAVSTAGELVGIAMPFGPAAMQAVDRLLSHPDQYVLELPGGERLRYTGEKSSRRAVSTAIRPNRPSLTIEQVREVRDKLRAAKPEPVVFRRAVSDVRKSLELMGLTAAEIEQALGASDGVISFVLVEG